MYSVPAGASNSLLLGALELDGAIALCRCGPGVARMASLLPAGRFHTGQFEGGLAFHDEKLLGVTRVHHLTGDRRSLWRRSRTSPTFHVVGDGEVDSFGPAVSFTGTSCARVILNGFASVTDTILVVTAGAGAAGAGCTGAVGGVTGAATGAGVDSTGVGGACEDLVGSGTLAGVDLGAGPRTGSAIRLGIAHHLNDGRLDAAFS